ncbi:Slime mold cyclic AMP receptor [Geosmithia morbida]|uniref:Slime mold cyclic AMP receptor n=1 Tax=Geosmithia morbida TaxID=1094350 RepID=A0A9P4YMS1_9HYPO|nr:Slime mold cyclic AMP receptor [Geosmithia morbida]KAF4119826.1 Slime mold cyclic AMP receptor [Geosmithia morbida]
MSEDQVALGSGSLHLTSGLQGGLLAIAIVACVSFVSSTVLFFYISYKLAWHFYFNKPVNKRQDSVDTHASDNIQDFELGIDGVFAGGREEDRQVHDGRLGPKRGKHGDHRQPPNQFLILIFNLLLADMHQALAFFLNIEWFRTGLIRVGTSTCFAQGLFISTGDLASSSFITAIAIHTYMSVIHHRTIPQPRLYTAILCIWLFVYAIATIPIAATLNGTHHGGFFVRAGAWCWMNSTYETLRLVTHYLFIFISLATTTCLYLAIVISLHRQALPTGPLDQETDFSPAVQARQQLSRNPAFLIYPLIYLLCTLPLALGRVASMAGTTVPLGYMCFAGVMIASNGMFDCLLFSTTRNTIVFASKHRIDNQSTGLQTFAFMKTPKSRRYGNMVWIQGGHGGTPSNSYDMTTGEWWSWRRLMGRKGHNNTRAQTGRHKRDGSSRISQESFRRETAIQMETVTSVVIEAEPRKDSDDLFPTVSTGSSVEDATMQDIPEW